MSRTLKENVKAEIKRRKVIRECRRHKEYDEWFEKEKMKIEEDPQKYIMDAFKLELEQRYRMLENFRGFNIVSELLSTDLIAMATDMKFEYDKENEIFTVPIFEKGSRRTHVQKILKIFEDELRTARKKRKKQLLDECKRIKNNIACGKFKDNPDGIYVKAKEDARYDFEEKIVYDFFAKFKLEFCDCIGWDRYQWVFKI